MPDDERVGAKRRRAGRRPSSVWSFFTEVRTADNKVYACCHFCPKRLAAVASRMRQHVLSKCVRAPPDIQQLLDQAPARTNNTAITTATYSTPICTDSITTDNTTSGSTSSSSSTTTTHDDTVEISATTCASTATVPVADVPGLCGSNVHLVAADRVMRQPNDVETEALPPIETADTEESRSPTREQTTTLKTGEVVEVVPVANVLEANGDERVHCDQHQLLEKSSDVDARRVHQKLVLALVVNDVPATILEDEALMEAFALAHPGLPWLSVDQAQTTVLQELVDEVTETIEQELATCAVLTLVHRHFKKHGGGTATGVASQWCNRWMGVDEHRKVFPLKETYQDVEPSVLIAANEAWCKYCPPREEFTAVVSTYRLSLAPDTVFCLCCDCPRTYQQLRLEQMRALSISTQDADSGSDLASRSTPQQLLVSTCAVRLSLRLRKELLNAFPALIDLLNKALFLSHSVSKITPLQPQLQTLLESSSWDAVPRLVKRMVYLENDIRRYQAKVSVPTDEVASFWDKLRIVDTLLTPLSWMLALSETNDTTSAQYVVLWLWLLAIVKSTTSSMLPEQGKESFVSVAMSIIECHVDSHELVCVLLDPRVAGAGFSISGKRRVKSLVVQLAERMFPSAGYSSGAIRLQLLNELGDYAEKTGVFADVVAWEMSVGRPPTLFWNDFVEDAPHLSRVARAVVSISPCAQTATESLNSPLPMEKASWNQTFAVRQLTSQVRTHRPPESTSGFKQYYSLLLPPSPLPQGSMSDGTLSLEVNKALRVNNTLRWSASDETKVEAIVTHHLSQMLQEGGGDSDADDSNQVPTSLPAAATQHDTLHVRVSWFAFQSANDLKLLQETVRKFVPRLATATIN
uniref:BED-type domain-containing protein n=1 Tax=Peronospora matthiolae TaxID=2874970 RepID=A0AAV1UR36_9STRA